MAFLSRVVVLGENKPQLVSVINRFRERACRAAQGALDAGFRLESVRERITVGARGVTAGETEMQEFDANSTASELIDSKIAALGDWRGETLAWARALIREAVPEVAEAVKWRKPTNPAGVPVWEHHGLLCTGETYKDKVKLTFAKGAALDDPRGLFNASLDGGTRRAIDIREGELPDAEALKALVRAAAAANAG
jgi:hypothetical protein